MIRFVVVTLHPSFSKPGANRIIEIVENPNTRVQGFYYYYREVNWRVKLFEGIIPLRFRRSPRCGLAPFCSPYVIRLRLLSNSHLFPHLVSSFLRPEPQFRISRFCDGYATSLLYRFIAPPFHRLARLVLSRTLNASPCFATNATI